MGEEGQNRGRKLRRTDCPWIKQKKNGVVINKQSEENEKKEKDQIENNSRRIEIQHQFGFINSNENSPMPDFKQMHSIVFLINSFV